jgi:HEAT repeat protein
MYHLSNIRTLLTEGFSDEELRRFCHDSHEFRPVYDQLAQVTGKDAIIDRLLEHADRTLQLEPLLAWAEQCNPDRYQLHRPYFDGDDAPTPAALAEARPRYLELMINRHQDLDFVGIPELKGRQALHLEEVFINLQAEVETETRQQRDLSATESGDTEPLRALEAARYRRETIKRRVSAHQALREHLKLVILGDPGAGKTTLLKHIILAFAQNQPDRLDLPGETRLPIFVRLYDYVAKRANHPGDYSLLDYFYTQAHENLMLNLPVGFFETELERGQGCVCLDGLDELGPAGLRREVAAAVAALVSRYPGNRYLVTSRLVGYNEAPLDQRNFVHHTVLPFSDDDIRRFVEKWYAAREKDPTRVCEQSEDLVKRIMAQPPLQSLAANPLMLTIIALMHRIEAELPHERVKLYDKCVTALIETWEQVKQLSQADRERPYYRRLRPLLEQLAFWLHTQPGTTGRTRAIKEGDLKLQISRFLLDSPKLQLDEVETGQEAEAFVALVKSRTGLLVEQGDGVYTFAHLTFQEYLAAAHLKRRYVHGIEQMWQVIQSHLHDPHWREVVLLLLGSLNEFDEHPTALVCRIFEITDDYEDVLHRHLFLAARALADRVQVDTKLRETIVRRLLELAQSDWLNRSQAIAALAELRGDEQAITGLLNLAQNRQGAAEIRSEAAWALGQLGRADRSALPLRALAQDPQVDANVRRAAILALGQLGQTNEAIALLQALVQDSRVDADVRRDAVADLGQLGWADEFSGLLALAQDPQVDASFRCHAAQMLRLFGQVDEAAPLLLALAQNPQVDSWDRCTAAEALGELGRVDEAAPLLLALFRDSQVDFWDRRTAAEDLGQLKWADESAPLLLTLAQEPQMAARVRRTAAEALGQLGWADQAILSGLLTLAQDPRVAAEVRCAAAQALGQLGWAEQSVLSGLLALAADPLVAAEVRSEAYDSLKALLGGEAQTS